MDEARKKQAREEALAGSAVAILGEFRQEFASAVLDLFPDAHQMPVARLCKLLPAAAVLFKVVTPPGFKWDTADDLVQEMAQALKDEADRRIKKASAGSKPTTSDAASTGSQPSQPSTTPLDEPTKQYLRFVAAASSLDQMAFDDLMVWHDALAPADKQRFYVLVAASSDVQLATLVKRTVPVLRAILAQEQAPVPPPPAAGQTASTPALPSYAQFRAEVAADLGLNTRINIFLAAKNIAPLKFWKAAEQRLGKSFKDKAEFAQLMNLSDDEVAQTLGLDFDADQLSKDFLRRAIDWAMK